MRAQLARWHAGRAMAAFALEDMHDVADPIEAAPGILGLAVPDAPAQALDLGDDHGFRLHSVGLVGRQSARRLLRVLEPHGDVEPLSTLARRAFSQAARPGADVTPRKNPRLAQPALPGT